MKWHKALGFGDDHYRYHDHDKLAHYANAATDIEFLMPFGFKEVEGIHSRTNFDLSQHEKFSGKNIKYFDPETNESYTPYVIETSIGVDRMFLSIMSASYCEERWRTAKPAWCEIACCAGSGETGGYAAGEEGRSAREGS